MSLKNILVHLDHTPQSPGRFELALALAHQHQAHLTGLYATATPFFHLRSAERSRQEVQADAEAQAAAVGVALDWAVSDEVHTNRSITEVVCLHAYYADLVVIGQPTQASGHSTGAPRDLPEKLVLCSGRPCLIVPFSGTFRSAGERVMVAWKAGRTAARAVHDALPFLLKAKQVTLLSLGSAASHSDEDESSLKELAGHLAYHGVEARTEHLLISGIGMGDALLNRATDEGIDLLVAGGFTPTQPGAIAGHLLKQMTVPVLMSN